MLLNELQELVREGREWSLKKADEDEFLEDGDDLGCGIGKVRGCLKEFSKSGIGAAGNSVEFIE